MKQSRIVILLTIVLIISLLINSVSAIAMHIDDEQPQSFKLLCNDDLMNSVFEDESKNHSDKAGELFLSLRNSHSILEIEFEFDDKVFNGNLNGTARKISTDLCDGFEGYYTGMVQNSKSSETVRIDAITIISGKDAYCGLTIYFSNDIPYILMFGERTEKVKNISKYIANEMASTESRISTENNLEQSVMVNAASTYMGSQYIMANNRSLAELSAYHSPDLRNQGVMDVKAKINTSATNIANYFRVDLGYGVNYSNAKVTQVEMTMCGRDQYLYAQPYSITPASGTTSLSMIVPYYTPTLGFGTVTIPITLSSTDVNTYGYPASSNNSNKVEWIMNKTGGWNLSEFDGDRSSRNGLTTSATYTYQGNVYNQFTADMRFTGYITLKYTVLTTAGDNVIHTFTPVGAGLTTEVHIIP